MVGDSMQTNHFGVYIEMKDVMNQATELEGIVRVNTLNGFDAAFLYVPNGDYHKRFDLPAFMKKYDGQKVAILGREYQKQVEDKTYNKLVVISAKPIEAAVRKVS